MNTRKLVRIRKWFSLIAIVSILSSLVVVVPTAGAYTGKDAPTWAAKATDKTIELGLRDAKLKPDFNGAVTRAAACFMFVKAFGEDSGVEAADLENPFADIDAVKDKWYADSAKLCYNFGWFAGKTVSGKKYFMGNDKFTREQFGTVLWAMAGKPEADEAVLKGLEGADKFSTWAKQGAAFSKESKLLFGDKKADAQGTANNAMMNVVVVNFLNAVDDGTVEVVYEPVESEDEDEDEDEEDEDEEDEKAAPAKKPDAKKPDEKAPDAKPAEKPATPATPGVLSVAVASDTPAARIIASGTAYNPLLKVTVNAGGDKDIKITALTVTRGGISANANVAGVGVFDDKDVRHGNIGTSWSDANQMTISFTTEPIVVPKGTQSFFMLKANLATGAMSGTLVLSLGALANITSDATLSGTFPLSSTAMQLVDGTATIGTVTVDAVQVHNNGTADTTAVNVNLGTTRQQLATFRLATGANESVKVRKVTLYNNGSAGDGDVTNLTLVAPDNTDLKPVVLKTAGKYAVFDFGDKPYALAKSASSKDFKLYGDLSGGSTRTARFLLQNDYDLVVSGDTSGNSILPTTAAGGNDTAFPIGDRSGANFINMVTISAGTLSFSKASTSPTGNIAAGGAGLVLSSWEVKPTGEDMEIRQIAYTITRSAATNLAGTLYFRVKDVGTLYSVAGSSAIYDTATTVASTFTTLTAGKTYFIEAVGDILSSAANGLTYRFTLDITQVKRINSNDIVDPTVNATAANTLTVRTGSLTVTANAGATAPQVVSGQSSLVTIATWDFTAGSGEGITLASLVVDDSTAGIGRNFKELEVWIDGAKRSQDSSSTTSPTATTQTVTFNITPSYTIAASQTAVVELKAKLLAAPADVSATVTMQVTASGVTGTGATSQTALSTIPAAAVNAQTVTINAAGSLVISRDTVINVKSSQIVAGTTNVTFGAFKFQTGNIEDVRIKRVTIRNIGSNTNGLVSMGLYDGNTLVNDNAATTANEGITKASFGADQAVLGNDLKSVTFDYSGNPYVISKNSSKVLTIKANTVYSATSGETAQFVIDSLELEGAGSSARIFPTITTETADTGAARAYALGEVAAMSNGTVAAGLVSPVTTAVALAATMDGAGAIFAGTDLVDATAALNFQVTMMNTVLVGSTIVSEAPSTAAVYNYAVGDVVALNDADVAANNNIHVVDAAVAVGATLLGASTPLAGVTLATGDRVTRLHGGFSQTTLASALVAYNLGDILAVVDDDVPANNGLYTVTNAIAVGGDMTAAAVVASQVVQLQSGAALATGDRVAKMATLHTEAPSTSGTFAYSVGDVIVVDDDSTPANNGVYVVETAVAVGGDLTAANALGTGIIFTTADRISKAYVKSQEDNLKRLYPTKLNFAWGTPASTTLTTGGQIEVARFTLGADAANANNPGALVSVTGLNFTSLASARVTNLTLNDLTLNVNSATNANSTNFTSAAAGGTLPTLTFQQGETRTYRILADVGTSAGSQVAQFRFNAGTDITAGTATWSVTSNAVTANSTWTALAADATDVSSSTLTSAAAASDSVAPTVAITVAAGTTNNSVINVDETLTLTFSERIDPSTVNASLTYGGSVTGVLPTGGGGIVVPNSGQATPVITITNVGTLTGNLVSDVASPAANWRGTVALNSVAAGGSVLTITTTTASAAWHATAALGDGGAQTVAATGTALRDAAGNLFTLTGSTFTDVDF